VQADWEATQLFKAVEDPRREKFYCLSMFPYPSGRLHIGHVRNYTIGDTIARYQRMLGKNVLQPMGWDAFGLPAENAAMEHKVSPWRWTRDNIASMRAQLQRLGFAYDWSREFATCTPDYYRWEQWLFTRLLQRGLLSRKLALVNWDPVDRTVLANEQVIDGRGWRSGAPVERREVAQWFLHITDYAEELLAGLDDLAGWPRTVLTMQRNWIGRSEGVEIDFLTDAGDKLSVYTTRADTLMGVTCLAVAPEHPLAQRCAARNPALADFLREAGRGAIAEAAVETVEKLGMPLGVEARHPLSGEPVPVWAANFVLMTYGTGVVMCVPAHDQRDWQFARKYRLPLRQVIFPAPGGAPADLEQEAYTAAGVLGASGDFDGLDSAAARRAIAVHLEQAGHGRRRVHYRLRDWGVSRQRRWGCPIPVRYDAEGTPQPVADEELPVLLEQQDTDGAAPPGAGRDNDAAQWTPERDTLDTFVESSWYYARFCCPDSHDAMLDERARYWLPVDQYVGGIEHAVLHLLYARFFHRLLRDEGLVAGAEPFSNLLTQGMVLKDGAKMSKSRGNTVDPQPLIERYGADTVRLYVMFAAPPEQPLEWSDQAIAGAHRFLKRLWHLAVRHLDAGAAPALQPARLNTRQRALRRHVHATIAKVNDDVSRRYTFNTAIAAVMELSNALGRYPVSDANDRALMQEGLETMVLLLAPIVPHVTDALWRALGHDEAVAVAAWPRADAGALEVNEVHLVVQVAGRRRGEVRLPPDASEESIRAAALAEPNVRRFLKDRPVQRCIIVPGRLVNLVLAPAGEGDRTGPP